MPGEVTPAYPDLQTLLAPDTPFAAPETPLAAPAEYVQPSPILPVVNAAKSNGPLEQGNIDLNHRPVVRNPDGSMSTVRSIGISVDGKEVLIPTVSPEGRILSNEDAIKEFQRTGKHLGKFATVEEANQYAQKLHEDQAVQYGAGETGFPAQDAIAAAQARYPGVGELGAPLAVAPSDASDPRDRRAQVLDQLAANTNRRMTGIDAAIDRETGAAKAQAGLNEELGAAQQPLLDQAPVIAEQSAKAIKGFNDAFQQQTTKAFAQLQEINDKVYAERNFDPANVWGNSNIGQKAANLLGVVAAGLNGQGAVKYADHLVDQAVALQKNRLNTYRAGINSTNNLLAQSTSILKSSQAGEQMYRSQLYDSLVRQGQALKNRFTSKQAQINLDEQIGQLELKRDTLRAAAVKDHYIYELQTMKGFLSPLQEEKLRTDIESKKVRTAATQQGMGLKDKHEAENDSTKATGHVDGPLEPKQKAKVTEDLSSGAVLVGNLNWFEDEIGKLESNLTPDNIRSFLAEAKGRNPVSFIEARIKSKTGAAINATEYEQNIAPFLADTKRLIAGEIFTAVGLRNYKAEIGAARRALTRASLDNLKTHAPARTIPASDPDFGRSLAEIQAEGAAKSKESDKRNDLQKRADFLLKKGANADAGKTKESDLREKAAKRLDVLRGKGAK